MRFKPIENGLGSLSKRLSIGLNETFTSLHSRGRRPPHPLPYRSQKGKKIPFWAWNGSLTCWVEPDPVRFSSSSFCGKGSIEPESTERFENVSFPESPKSDKNSWVHDVEKVPSS